MSTVTLKSLEFGTIIWTLPPQYAHLEEELLAIAKRDPAFKDAPANLNGMEAMARTSMEACAKAILSALDDLAKRRVGVAIRTLDKGILKAAADMRSELP